MSTLHDRNRFNAAAARITTRMSPAIKRSARFAPVPVQVGEHTEDQMRVTLTLDEYEAIANLKSERSETNSAAPDLRQRLTTS